MVQRSEARSSGRPEAPHRLYEGYVFDLDGTIYLGDERRPALHGDPHGESCRNAFGRLVLTGETTERDLAGESEENLPDYALERIDQLVPRDLWDEFGWEDK